MTLPEEISAKILQILEMPGLDQTTKSAHNAKLQVLKQQMRKLAANFMTCKPSEEQYTNAYFAYNFPTNLMKTLIVTKEIESRYPGVMSGRTRVKVLDIGCGDGAAICGLYYALKDSPFIKKFNCTGVDFSRSMLERARVMGRWLAGCDVRVKIRFRWQRITDRGVSGRKSRYDVIVCVNSLAEIVQGDNIPVRFVRAIEKCLTDGGFFVVIEPALKKYTRRLMMLRDELAAQRRASVILPCLHDDPCTLMKVDSREEWCHQSLDWSPPDFLKVINQGLNREIDVLKFAYLVIAKGQMPCSKPDGYRVISQLLKEKGKQRCFICTPQGRVELIKFIKSRTADNKVFDSICKGDILKLQHVDAQKRQRWYITEKTVVEIIKQKSPWY